MTIWPKQKRPDDRGRHNNGEAPLNSPEESREIEALQRRIIELENELTALRASTTHPQREPRVSLKADVDVTNRFGGFNAHAVDRSDGGFCLEFFEPLPFEMTLRDEDQEHVYNGSMVWMRAMDEGGYRLGFKLKPPDLAAKW